MHIVEFHMVEQSIWLLSMTGNCAITIDTFLYALKTPRRSFYMKLDIEFLVIVRSATPFYIFFSVMILVRWYFQNTSAIPGFGTVFNSPERADPARGRTLS
jgi:hypothetical protein